MQPSRKKGRLLEQLHQQLCGHSSTTLSATRKDTKFQREKEKEKSFRKIQDSISNDKTMVFFNPSRSIILRTEASYNQGLSAALLQKTDNGIQPVHFISHAMTKTEKRYSQTEKDALAIKRAKERLRVHLLGAPRFCIHNAQTTVNLIQ